jgi:hypothetical protein
MARSARRRQEIAKWRAAGGGADGFNIESGASAGWPTDMEPPPYETPLRPGPHGG